MRPPLINIADYPPPHGSNDWWPSYRRAVDAIRASDKPGVIYTPARSEPYQISQPILADVPNLSFAGDGADVSVIQTQNFSDAIQFGVQRTSRKLVDNNTVEQTLTPHPDYWVDSTPPDDQPYLDASAGQRYGLRTRGIAYGYFQGTPFDLGPLGGANWSATRQLSIDFAVYNPAGWVCGDRGIRLFGMGDPDNRRPSPFYCGVLSAGSTVFFDFATQDGVVRRATFVLPAPETLLQRVSVQLDLTVPVVLAFVNRTQVRVELSRIGPGWGRDLSLRANEFRQCQVGTCMVAGEIAGQITEQTMFGFKLTGATLYQDDCVGGVQVRGDGATLDDARQFFATESAFSALLPLQDSGNCYRHIPWHSTQAGGSFTGGGSGLFLHDTSLGVADTVIGNCVRDLTLRGVAVPNSTAYGRALCHGPVYDFKARDCIFFGGAHNFGALNGAVGYPINVSDCEFDYGGDAAIYAQGCGMWWGERLTIKYWGRTAIRSLSSFLDLRQVFYAPGGPGDCVLKLHNSAGAILDNHVMDFEGGGPALAHVFCEAGSNQGPVLLTLRNVVFGSQAAGANYIVLVGPNSPDHDHPLATLTLENTQHVGFSGVPGIWTVKQL